MDSTFFEAHTIRLDNLHELQVFEPYLKSVTPIRLEAASLPSNLSP